MRDQWGSHFTLGRAFAALIGKPAVMKLALRTGMPIPVLMRFVVRLLANLTDPAAKGFEDRVIRVLESLVPATSNQAATRVQPGRVRRGRVFALRRQLRGFRNKKLGLTRDQLCRPKLDARRTRPAEL